MKELKVVGVDELHNTIRDFIVESKTIIGYSNFANLLSIIKYLDAFKTNKLETRIRILK